MAKKKHKQAKKKPKNPVVSFSHDLGVLKKLIANDQLGDLVRQLDSKKIDETLVSVPLEVIRLLAVLLSSKEQEDQIKVLKQEEREPLTKLVSMADEYNAREYVSALIKRARQDHTIIERLGFPADHFSISAEEAKMFNTITSVKAAPIMMLKSSRLYAEVGFYQQDNLLLRSTMEIDELLFVAKEMLGAVTSVLDSRIEAAPSADPKLPSVRCKTYLKSIRNSTRLIGSHLSNGSGVSGKVRKKKARVAKT